MPFPAFLPLDYNVARALAWQNALDHAINNLPSAALYRLWDLDCDTQEGKLALASLLFPVSTVTPDISSSRNIQVFLTEQDKLQEKAIRILENPERFLIQLVLFIEMRDILRAIKKTRPDSVADAEDLSEKLDPLAQTLEQIWQLSRKLEEDRDVSVTLEDASSVEGQATPILLQKCRQKLASNENHAALSIAEKIVLNLEEKEGMPDLPKNYLLAVALHLRGMAHWRQAQLALAATDFERAREMLSGIGLPVPERGEIDADLGELKRHRKDLIGMCKAFREACAHGHCAPLADARMRGECLVN